MSRIKKGPVPGISLKLQEAERERRHDLMPERSVTEPEGPITADDDTIEMIRKLQCNISIQRPSSQEVGQKKYVRREAAIPGA